MIAIRSKSEIGKLQRSADIVVAAHRAAFELTEPGVSTMDIEKAVRKEIEKYNARPAFLGYMGTYPAATCISINEEVVHGIPSDKRKLEDGDIVGIDIGVEKDGYYGDAAFTIPVGNVSASVAALLKQGKECLDRAIMKAVSGYRLGDVSHE
ncbi:MAG: M24 family metallopeptidase, partial [bacterium]|nr:M24 family metallopeptidase [bacterium]